MQGKAPRSSLLADTLKYLFRNRSAVLGMILISLLVLIALLAPVMTTHNPLQSMIGQPGHTGQLPARAPCIHALGCPETEPQHLMGLSPMPAINSAACCLARVNRSRSAF